MRSSHLCYPFAMHWVNDWLDLDGPLGVVFFFHWISDNCFLVREKQGFRSGRFTFKHIFANLKRNKHGETSRCALLASAHTGTSCGSSRYSLYIFFLFLGGKSRKKHQAFKARFSIVLGILTYSFIMCLFQRKQSKLCPTGLQESLPLGCSSFSSSSPSL